MLPFTHDQFLDVFGRYNLAVWPAQFVAYAIGALACVLVARRSRLSSTIVPSLLALMWGWTGIVYHAMSFARINPAAYVFATAFCVQGLLLCVAAFARRLTFPRPTIGIRAAAGWALIAYAMGLYPLIGLATGMAYPRIPMFGITPCPLTIFTFGVFLLSGSAPWWLWVVPLAWSIIGGSAAWLLRVPQDWLLVFSGMVAVPLFIRSFRLYRERAVSS